MFYILPASLRLEGETLPAAYLYALAVDPAHRSRGIAGEILRYLDAALPAQGYAAAVLRPAEASLFGFYARYGYTQLFTHRRWDFEAVRLPPARGRLFPARLDTLPGGRDRFLQPYRPFFSWGPQMLRYVESYHALYGIRTALLRVPAGEGYAVYGIEKGRLHILELCGARPQELAALLCRETGAQGGAAYLPGQDCPGVDNPVGAVPGEEAPGEYFPCAALKWLGAPRPFGRGYFALGLD